MIPRIISASLLLAIYLGGMAWISSAQAQLRSRCVDYNTMATKLEEQFGETPRVRALQNNGFLLVLFASDGGTWTAILLSPNRCARLVAAGQAWTEVEREPVGEPA